MIPFDAVIWIEHSPYGVFKMEAPLTYVQYVKGASIGQGVCSVRHKEYFILSVLV